MPDTLPPPISMSVEAGTCGATGKPASPPNSLQGIVANRRHGKPATALRVVRWHTHHTLTACHRWRRQAEPADIMQAASTLDTMPDTLPPPISMSVEAGTCGATGKPASPPNSLQGIVANRRHGKPATALRVVRWHTHHTLTACHRWRRQAEPADIMQAASTKPHWDWGTTAPQATQRKRTKKKSKPMHNTHYPLGNPPQRGSVCVMHTHMGNEQRKEPKERRGLAPPWFYR